MACTNHTYTIYQGEEFNEFFGWVDDDGTHIDMTGDTAELLLLQNGAEVVRYTMVVNYVDANTKQINGIITPVETTALTAGDYSLLLKVIHAGDPVYMPRKGNLFLEVKAAL